MAQAVENRCLAGVLRPGWESPTGLEYRANRESAIHTPSVRLLAARRLSMRIAQMQYNDGQEIHAGDSVLIDDGKRTGVVEDVIDGDVKRQLWGVDEPGVMIRSEYYGLRFLCMEEVRHEEVRLLSLQRGMSEDEAMPQYSLPRAARLGIQEILCASGAMTVQPMDDGPVAAEQRNGGGSGAARATPRAALHRRAPRTA